MRRPTWSADWRDLYAERASTATEVEQCIGRMEARGCDVSTIAPILRASVTPREPGSDDEGEDEEADPNETETIPLGELVAHIEQDIAAKARAMKERQDEQRERVARLLGAGASAGRRR